MGRSQEEFPLLKARGLKACEILGDGNCLFNAFSDQLYGDQSKHAEIRKNVCQFMRENPTDFIPFITVDQGQRRNPKRKNAGAYSSQYSLDIPTEEQVNRAWEDHLKRMAQNGTYGDNLEIRAFGQAYNMDVKIFRFEKILYQRAAEDGVVRPIAYIALHEWEHYSSVRNIDGPFTGLPNVQEKNVSPEDEARINAAAPKNAPIHDWMIKNVMTSVPHLCMDEVAIRKKLEESGGNVDKTVSKLLDADYLSSNPPSPGSYSQSGSSSIERDPDSDDDEIYGPNKRQNRRMSQATKSSRKSSELGASVETDLHAIPTIELTEPDSQCSSKLPPPSQLPPLSQLPVKSELPEPSGDSEDIISGKPTVRKTKKADDDDGFAPSDDENDDDCNPDYDNDAASSYSVSSRSAPVSFGTTPPQRITIKLNTRNNKSMQKQNGPRQKKPTARERKDLKKAAQKQARKESKSATKQPQLATSTTSINQNRNRNSPPMEKVMDMTTLYI